MERRKTKKSFLVLALMLVLLSAPLGMMAQRNQSKGVEPQEGYLVGTVTDEKGEPLIGVSIKFKDNNYGTTTSSDGSFHLPTAKVSSGTIVFS